MNGEGVGVPQQGQVLGGRQAGPHRQLFAEDFLPDQTRQLALERL